MTTQPELILPRKIEVRASELQDRIRAIHAGGGTISRMDVSGGEYVLHVFWNDQQPPECGCDICADRRDGEAAEALAVSWPASVKTELPENSRKPVTGSAQAGDGTRSRQSA